MGTIYTRIGAALCLGGGVAALVALVGLICVAGCRAWVAFCNRFRRICGAESLIHEYKKNRAAFLSWRDAGEVGRKRA